MIFQNIHQNIIVFFLKMLTMSTRTTDIFLELLIINIYIIKIKLKFLSTISFTESKIYDYTIQKYV